MRHLKPLIEFIDRNLQLEEVKLFLWKFLSLFINSNSIHN